jgi:hypothetical protein
MKRRIGWIRLLGLLCAGVCAAPVMVAQTDGVQAAAAIGCGTESGACGDGGEGTANEYAEDVGGCTIAAGGWRAEAVDDGVYAAGNQCSAERFSGDCDYACAHADTDAACTAAAGDVYLSAFGWAGEGVADGWDCWDFDNWNVDDWIGKDWDAWIEFAGGRGRQSVVFRWYFGWDDGGTVFAVWNYKSAVVFGWDFGWAGGGTEFVVNDCKRVVDFGWESEWVAERWFDFAAHGTDADAANRWL